MTEKYKIQKHILTWLGNWFQLGKWRYMASVTWHVMGYWPPPQQKYPPVSRNFLSGGLLFFSAKVTPQSSNFLLPPPTMEISHMAACKKHMFIFLKLLPVYKTTNLGFVGIGCQWLPMATNNLLIDYKYTIIALTNFLPIMIGTNW